MALMWVISACDGGSGEDPAPPDTYEVELFDNTIVWDASVTSALTEISPDGTLVFQEPPASVLALERLNVVVAGRSEATPEGLLRMVTRVDAGPDATRIETVPVPIQVAFRKLNVEFTREVTNEQLSKALATSALKVGKAGRTLRLELDEALFNADDDPTTPDDQVIVEALLEGGFEYTFGIDFDWGAVAEIPKEILECVVDLVTGDRCRIEDLLPEARVGYHFEAGLFIDLYLEGVAYRSFERSWTVPGVTLQPIPIGFLVFIPQVDLDVTMRGEASSRFELTAQVDAGAQAGVMLSTHHSPRVDPPEAWFDYEAPNIDPTLSAQAYAAVGPRLAIKLYGLMGPYASVRGFADLSADFDRDPCFEAHAGLDGKLGMLISIDVPIFGSYTIADWGDEFEFTRRPIGSGRCPGSAGPGSGPGSLEGDFQAPSFAPWAATHGSALHRFPFEGPGAQAEWGSLVRDIDGRYVFGGSTSRAVVKFDEWGEQIWARRFLAPDVAADLDTRELMMGGFAPMRHANLLAIAHPYALLELTPSGDLASARRFDARYRQSWSRFTDIAPRPDGGFYVVGMYGNDEYDARAVDTWLLTLNAAGEITSSRLFGTEGEGEMALDVLPLVDGALVVGATWNDANVEWRASALRLNEEGEVIWGRRFPLTDCYGHGDDMHFQRSILTPEGDFVLGGTVDSGPIGAAVLKLKPDGELAWADFNTAGGTAIGTTLTDLVALPTSGYLVAGTYIAGNADDDIWLGSTTAAGQLQWIMRYGRPQDPEGGRTAESYPALSLTEDGGVLVASHTLRSVGSGTDTDGALWALKVPARSGEVALNPASGYEARPASLQTKAVCIDVEDWTVASRDLPIAAQSFPVTVESVPRAVERQTD